jgi:tight adherence protein C
MLAVFLAVFLGVALAAYALLSLAFSDDRRVSKRLQNMTEYEIAQSKEAQPMLKSFSERVIAPSAQSVGRAARAALPTTYRERLAKRLDEAGRPRGLDVDRFVFAQLVAVLGLAALSVAVGAALGWSASRIALVALVAGVLGAVAPDLWLRSRISSRKHTIVRELPDMLDMLTISVEAGLGFDSALAKLVRTSRGPLAEEFGRVLQEIQAGSSRKEALRAMAERVDTPELSTFVASIIQADMFGVSIVQVLRAQSADMRLRRRQRAEEVAQRAPVKMVFPIVFCILPATLIVVAGPAVVRIAQVFMGI